MPLFKNKYFLPVCLAGVLAGYGAAEWVMPRYFEAPTQIQTSAPLATQNFMAILGAQPKYYRQTASGNYLAGQFAQREKDWEKASDFMSRVLEKEPDNIVLKKHTMVLAMASGHVNRAVALAKQTFGDEEPSADDVLATLFIALEDFESENYLGSVETLNKTEPGSVAAFIVPILKLWADTAQGKLSLETLEENYFYAYHAMLAGSYLNKGSEAVQFALKAYNVEDADIRDVEKVADLFAKFGETEKAQELYELIIDKGFESEEIKEKITLLEKDQPIDDLINIPTIKKPKDGAAVVFYDMAEVLLREYSDDSATIFAQMALFLNAEMDAAHMIIGNVLVRHDQNEDAIAEYKKIKQDQSFYKAAQRMIADLYAEEDKDEDAIKILEKLYETENEIEALVQIGDIYRFDEDYKSAVEAYNEVLNLWDDVPEKYWHVLYARGMSYERLKKFKKSDTDLLAALKFRPDHPYLLNYLGYSWADQGINLDKALDMIKRAALAKPADGYIADSLGWVYYKMSDFESAIPHLERAVELRPYDATINDHLGDAYWRSGRKLEARFQWQRAANYSEESEAELKTTVEEKLVSGLPALPESKKTMTGAMSKELEEKTKPSL